MDKKFFSYHFNDSEGNPEGGAATGRGFTISWQKGPLKIDGVEIAPNGAQVEEIIEVAIDRIEFFEDSQFSSPYNMRALDHLKLALNELNCRTMDRESRGVEGTHNK